MLSYAYPNYLKSKIIYWEYSDGVKHQCETDMPLYFFIEDKDGEYKTIHGKTAKKLEFTKWKQFKEKRLKYQEYGVKMYESDISLQTKFICNHYYGQTLKAPKEFNTFFIDIEVHIDHGFPHPTDALGKITLITIYSTRDKKFYVFAEKDFDATFIKTKLGFEYQKRIHISEEDLLRDFITFIRNEHPDIISGWNSQDYDLPYIVNRARKILDPEIYERFKACSDKEQKEFKDKFFVDQMSPVDNIRTEEVRDKKQGIFRKQYFISGINCLDLMEVYKNYTASIKSSYALDAICVEEIGEGKKKFDGTFAELYENWQDYCEYNLIDVDLLRKLDDKLGYIDLLITFCYGCKVPFEHYSKTTRVLDGAFISKLIEEQIVLPDVNRALIDEMKRLKDITESGLASDEDLDKINNIRYVGGYVADPEKGSHEWVESFDATSLYPSIMIGWNISPETKLGTVNDSIGVNQIYEYINGVTIDGDREVPFTIGSKNGVTSVKKIATLIKKNNYCLAANGTFYRQDFVGVIPKFVAEWFDKRKLYKKMMMDCKKNGDNEGAKYYHMLQYSIKILINSVYGFLGTRYSRLYDVDNARAVTLTGQMGLKRTMTRLNTYFQTEWKDSDIGKSFNANNFKDFIIYGDTDSVYVSAGRFLKSFDFTPHGMFTDEEMENLKTEYKVDRVEQKDGNINFITIDKATNKDKIVSHEIEHERTINFLNNNFEPLVQRIIEENMINYSINCANCKINKLFFKRESITRSAIFLEKKKYAMWLLNDEDNIPANKLKVTGLDIVRSNTPMVAKKVLKDMVFDILRKMNRDHTVAQIKATRETFIHSPPDAIARFAPVNGLTKYKDKFTANNDQFKSTPNHVRAAMIYNMILEERADLQDAHDFIYNGDKIKYIALKTGADWSHNVIAYKGPWISELNIDQYIDYDAQFQVAILNLMEKLFNLMEWELPRFDCHEFASIFKKKT